MSSISIIAGLERILPFLMFSLYLLTAVRVCRYSTWRDAGEPNPFLPRALATALADAQPRMRRTC